MKFDIESTWNSVTEGTKEVADLTHEKLSDFHETYVSKVLPDCGKYGDAAKFAAEMVPGVSEYNAIVEGDWKAFAIAAGVDVGAVAAGAFTGGAGYAAVKGGTLVAGTGAKAAVKGGVLAARTGTKAAVKEIAEAGVKKTVLETVEAGAKKVVQETAEVSTEKVVKETAETSVKKSIKEMTEEGTEKSAREAAEMVGVKAGKEIGEEMDKRFFPEYLKKIEEITHREIKPNQMEKIQKALKEQKFVKLDPEKATLHRKLFNNAKDRLIDEWEKNTGQEWPVYTEGVLNEAGEVIRKARQRYDAHHLIESSFGGPNAWWNLHPAAFPAEHQLGIHGDNGFARIIF